MAARLTNVTSEHMKDHIVKEYKENVGYSREQGDTKGKIKLKKTKKNKMIVIN